MSGWKSVGLDGLTVILPLWLEWFSPLTAPIAGRWHFPPEQEEEEVKASSFLSVHTCSSSLTDTFKNRSNRWSSRRPLSDSERPLHVIWPVTSGLWRVWGLQVSQTPSPQLQRAEGKAQNKSVVVFVRLLFSAGITELHGPAGLRSDHVLLFVLWLPLWMWGIFKGKLTALRGSQCHYHPTVNEEELRRKLQTSERQRGNGGLTLKSSWLVCGVAVWGSDAPPQFGLYFTLQSVRRTETGWAGRRRLQEGFLESWRRFCVF